MQWRTFYTQTACVSRPEQILGQCLAPLLAGRGVGIVKVIDQPNRVILFHKKHLAGNHGRTASPIPLDQNHLDAGRRLFSVQEKRE